MDAVYQLALLDLADGSLNKFHEHSETSLELLASSLKVKKRALERVEVGSQRENIKADYELDLFRSQRLLRFRAESAYHEERLSDALSNMDRMVWRPYQPSKPSPTRHLQQNCDRNRSNRQMRPT